MCQPPGEDVSCVIVELTTAGRVVASDFYRPRAVNGRHYGGVSWNSASRPQLWRGHGNLILTQLCYTSGRSIRFVTAVFYIWTGAYDICSRARIWEKAFISHRTQPTVAMALGWHKKAA